MFSEATRWPRLPPRVVPQRPFFLVYPFPHLLLVLFLSPAAPTLRPGPSVAGAGSRSGAPLLIAADRIAFHARPILFPSPPASCLFFARVALYTVTAQEGFLFACLPSSPERRPEVDQIELALARLLEEGPPLIPHPSISPNAHTRTSADGSTSAISLEPPTYGLSPSAFKERTAGFSLRKVGSTRARLTLARFSTR